MSIQAQTYFGTQKVITTSADGGTSIYSADLDGDGDQDVLSTSYFDNKIAWYENTDGKGNFGTQQVITTSADKAQSVYSADLDGDGDQDVLSASYEDDKIAWYENTDGNGTFGTQQVITTSADGAYSVYSADIDGDGDQDVLSASLWGNKIAWYENTDGNGNFGAQQVISTSVDGPQSVYSVDLDGDGDKDVLSASFHDDKIAWYENSPAPEIITQPQNQTGCPNTSFYFSLSANYIGDYQWYVNEGSGFVDLSDNAIYSGTTTNTLTIVSASLNMNGYIYSCVLSNLGGVTNSDEAVLTIEDNENPEITSTHEEQQIDANANCETTLPDYTVDVTATDNCDSNLDITQSPTAGTIIFGTTNEVILTVTDDEGNYTEVSFNVEIEDNTNPEITSTHTDQSISDGVACDANLPDYIEDVIANDNCDSELEITQSPTAGTIITGLTNTITLTATDDAGNYAEVSFNVEVIDTTNPYIECTDDLTVYLNEGQNIYYVTDNSLNPLQTIDNCGIFNVSNSFNSSSTLNGAAISIGNTEIIWTIEDNAGNTSNCSFVITVNEFSNIQILQQNGISIYPNPTNGIINFEFANNNIQQIVIFDITGKQIIEKTAISQNAMIDLSSFESGIYIVKIQTDNEIFTTKIVKE